MGPFVCVGDIVGLRLDAQQATRVRDAGGDASEGVELLLIVANVHAGSRRIDGHLILPSGRRLWFSELVPGSGLGQWRS